MFREEVLLSSEKNHKSCKSLDKGISFSQNTIQMELRNSMDSPECSLEFRAGNNVSKSLLLLKKFQDENVLINHEKFKTILGNSFIPYDINSNDEIMEGMDKNDEFSKRSIVYELYGEVFDDSDSESIKSFLAKKNRKSHHGISASCIGRNRKTEKRGEKTESSISHLRSIDEDFVDKNNIPDIRNYDLSKNPNIDFNNSYNDNNNDIYDNNKNNHNNHNNDNNNDDNDNKSSSNNNNNNNNNHDNDNKSSNNNNNNNNNNDNDNKCSNNNSNYKNNSSNTKNNNNNNINNERNNNIIEFEKNLHIASYSEDENLQNKQKSVFSIDEKSRNSTLIENRRETKDGTKYSKSDDTSQNKKNKNIRETRAEHPIEQVIQCYFILYGEILILNITFLLIINLVRVLFIYFMYLFLYFAIILLLFYFYTNLPCLLY